MKKLLFLSTVVLTVLSACAQDRKSPHETVEGKDVKVTYGRPLKKGRVIFGDLEKYGKVWRTGADEATEITFAKDAKVAGQPVKAGTYTLFTIPEEKERSEEQQQQMYCLCKLVYLSILSILFPGHRES